MVFWFMRVYILLFNANTSDEGIHTIQSGDRDKVLMFQEEDDATRFAILLEAQDFPEPTVEAIDAEEIKMFCEKANYEWEIIESGKLAVPPEKNLEQTAWDLEKDQESSSQTSSEQEPTEEEENDLSSNELNKIRNQLEGLL